MKNQQIFIIIGVIAFLLIIFNWNKIFGKTETKREGGNLSGGSGNKQKLSCECPPGYISECVVSDISFRGCKWCCNQPEGRIQGGRKTIRKKP